MFKEVFFVGQLHKCFPRFFKKTEQLMDSAVALNKTKRVFFKLQQDLMDTLYCCHSANLLTLDTVCIKNRLSG